MTRASTSPRARTGATLSTSGLPRAGLADATLLGLVDAGDLRGLFVEKLGWANPDRPPVTVPVDGVTYTLTQVAGFKGLRVWACPVLPDRRTQRHIDTAIGVDNLERLVIFTSPTRQEWRWPRRAQTGGVNAKLLVHPHTVGGPNPDLATRLRAIAVDFDTDIALVELLNRMRAAFDAESETASVQAARLMNALYAELDIAGVDEHTATLLLARVLFLLFADDSDMWITRPDPFKTWLGTQTTPATLHTDLVALFDVLDTDDPDRRTLPADSPLRVFRYVNGGLFAHDIALPPLPAGLLTGLLAACEFDWSLISPAVFGSMFQTVKSKEARRSGGEHYTTEVNILKTIGPLFLDDLHERLDAAWDDKGQLTRLHNDLGRLRVLDPACGCGNFLIVAYRELRALELEILKRRANLDVLTGVHTGGVNRSQGTLDVTDQLRVRLDHFAGIEIDEWPARIASVAMLLIDHLANQRVAEEFGVAPDRLPIRIAPAIHAGTNALRVDWATIFTPSDDVIVVGNPPFIGMNRMGDDQQDDNRHVFATAKAAGLRTGRLDYVACWYVKALEYMHGTRARAAFVSTNSLTQGEQARTMVPLLTRHGAKVDFGHRTFRWTSEAIEAAVVHVVILGFSAATRPTTRRLFDYPNVAGDPVQITPTQLNFYLVDGPDIAPAKVHRPLTGGLPLASKGSQPTDDGWLLVEAEEYAEVAADPIAGQYLRRFVQGKDMLNDQTRWCLWMVGADPEALRRSALLSRRLDAVTAARKASPTESVRRQATTPHLFTQTRQPTHRYIALPEVSSENREWIPGALLDPEVIAGNKLIVWQTDEPWIFAYLQSSAFMAWVRTYGGRLKSDLSIAPGLVYFTFPFAVPTPGQRAQLERTAQSVLDARATHPGATLADLYDSRAMPAELRTAHQALDVVIDGLYDLTVPTESERMKVLLRRYQELTTNRSR